MVDARSLRPRSPLPIPLCCHSLIKGSFLWLFAFRPPLCVSQLAVRQAVGCFLVVFPRQHCVVWVRVVYESVDAAESENEHTRRAWTASALHTLHTLHVTSVVEDVPGLGVQGGRHARLPFVPLAALARSPGSHRSPGCCPPPLFLVLVSWRWSPSPGKTCGRPLAKQASPPSSSLSLHPVLYDDRSISFFLKRP